MNYYELFGIPVTPVVDQALLSKKYISLQRESHPDFFTKELEVDQEQALDKSADINKAYKTFKDPDASLAYFLQVKGVIEPDEKYELPPDFLMEMMDLNENLSDNPVAGRRDAENFKMELLSEQEEYLKALTSNADNLKTFQAMKSLFYRKKYLNRILERLDD